MKFEFDKVHADGELHTNWDYLLRIVGDFALWVGGEVIYREVDFCLVEFAVALASWLSIAGDERPDFVYTSVESETQGLVRFTRQRGDEWRVSAAHEERPSESLLQTEEIDLAAVRYLSDLRRRLLPRLDLLDCIESPVVRKVLHEKLG